MEKAPDEEGATVDDGSDEHSEGESDFVEVDPTGRYGRYKEVLGKGAYKTVYKAFDDLDGIEVAWNQVKIHDVVHTAGDMERLFSELHLLKTLKHKNIIKFYTSWVDTRSKNVNFITEIFTSGTLRQYRKKHRHVNLRAIKHWSRQILRGLVFLHSRDPPIIHRDLKCDNVFINGNTGEVKIGDLGLATILRQAPTAQSVIGTPEFMAPELYEEHYNELVDIYSFGMCLLEMITSEYPYSECTNAAQIYRKVTTGKKPAVLNKVNDPETRKFVEKCLASASERLQARELLMDPFLRSDEDVDMLESSHHTIRNSYANFGALESIPEDSYSRPISSAQKLNVVSKSSQPSSPSKEGISGPGSSSPGSSSPKEGLKSTKDFRIKGRKQDDKKVLVRIRIASSGGEVRVIQFDFDVEADTAMSVANEMVTELDLSDQDVSTIADMIDAEIMALIPDWKPGLDLDEVVDDAVTEQKGPIEGTSESQEVRAYELPAVYTPDTTMGPSDDLQSASGPGPTYGRFEEVGSNVIGSDLQQEESDSLGFFSDFSSEASGSDSSLDARSSIETGVDNDSTVQSFKSVETDAKSDSLPSSVGKLPQNMGAEVGDAKENLLPLGSDDRLNDSEVGRLMMQQEEELQILRSKHKLALLDLKAHMAQNASRSEDKDLSRDILINEYVQLSGSSERLPNDTEASKSVASVDRVEDATGNHNSTGTLTGQLLEESRHTEGSSFADNASTNIVFVDPASGSHDMVRKALKASVVEETVSKTKTLLNEVAPLDDAKKAPIINGGDVRRAVAEVVGSPLTESKPTACLDKGVHSCSTSRPIVELSGLESRHMPAGHEDAKPGLASITKRESYLELYKAASNKDNIFKSRSSELLATGDGVSKTSDANQEQLKKQQLQKSIADLEAKTLENLSQSKNKYFVGTGVKCQSGVTLQNGQQGASVKNHGGASIQTGQQGASVKNLPCASIQSGQQGVTAKNLPGATSQSGQQGSTLKNVPGASIHNGQQNAMVKNFPAATIQNSQQVAMKSYPGAALQNGQQTATSKGLPGASAQNGQQSASVKIPTGAPVQPGSAVKNHPGGTTHNGQQSTMGKALTGASNQQAAHSRQQHIQTETTRA